MANKVMCLANCGHVLFVSAPVDERGDILALVEGPDLDYDKDHDAHFMTCPNCGARNGFKRVPTPPGAGAKFELNRLLE